MGVATVFAYFEDGGNRLVAREACYLRNIIIFQDATVLVEKDESVNV